uniref:FLYWCH-type domain-containing protein n=1 Tax=Cacopsylla melanoneura TaxID=428564 RepID=A0A8D8QKX7_9HEMI
MELSVKIFSDTSIVTQDNSKFVTNTNPARYLRKSNHILYTCATKLCPARISLTTDKDRILSADLQHNHPIGESTRKNINSSSQIKRTSTSISKTPVSKPKNLKPKTLVPNLTNPDKTRKPSIIPSCKPRTSNIISSRNSHKSTDLSSPANNSIPSTSAAPLISKYKVSRVSTKVSSESPTTSIHNNIQQGDANNPRVPINKTKTKVVIITDSMGRGLRELLSASLPNIEVTASIYPNGKFNQCLQNVEQICSGLTKQDFVYIMCGTNNTCALPPNSCPRLDLGPIRNIQNRTNVIVSSILYRHDALSVQNTNICYTNEYLAHLCQGINVSFLQCNAFLKRRHYTRHGLHLNLSGKRVVFAKLKNFILSLSFDVDDAHSDFNLLDITCPFNQSLESTFADFQPGRQKSAANVVPPVVDLSETLNETQSPFRVYTP